MTEKSNIPRPGGQPPRGGETAEVRTSPDAARLQLVMGYLQEFKPRCSLRETMLSAIDILIKVSGQERGYAFILGASDTGEVDFTEVASRSNGKEGQFLLSRSLIVQSVGSDAGVLIEDASEGNGTNSMRDLKLRSVIVLPIYSAKGKDKKEVRALLYADRQFASSKIPAHTKQTLRGLAGMLADALDACEDYSASVERCQAYAEYLKSVAFEIEKVKEDLDSSCSRIESGNLKIREIEAEKLLSEAARLTEIAQLVGGAT